MRRRGIVVGLALALVGLTACGDGTAQTDSPLADREFLSQSLVGHTLVQGTTIRLAFKADFLSTSAGCNLLGAPYEVADGRLVLHEGLSSTDMGCDPPRHTQDEWLAELLQSKPRLSLGGNALTLTAPSLTIRFLDRVEADPDRPLVGTLWTVDTIVRGDAASSVADTNPVTLSFDENGQVTATARDCTSVSVPVQADESAHTLEFAAFAHDDIGCPGPWNATIEILSSPSVRYAIRAARLTMEGIVPRVVV